MACCSSREKETEGVEHVVNDPPPGQEKQSGAWRLFAWLGNNATQIAVAGAQAKLLEVSPTLLQDGERVEMAFKVERDHFYFTTKRILFRNKSGITGQRVSYTSLPYRTIKAFSVQSAGKLLDGDSELTVWSSGLGQTTMNFVKVSVDIYAIQRYFNAKVLHEGVVPVGDVGVHAEVGDAGSGQGKTPEASAEEFLNVLFDDARQIDAEAVEGQLKASPAVLEKDETVQLAFRCGRDSTLFTSKRILLINVKGLTGTKVEYRTVLWKSIRAFSTESAGGFLDRDAEVKLYTNMKEMRCISQDLRKGKCDVVAIKRFISNMVLGLDTVEAEPEAVSFEGRPDAGSSTFLEWAGDDARQIDAAAVDRQLHAGPAVLQGCERVEMAFKGRRDMTVFTTKRLLIVDMKSVFSGKKVKYLSVPWTTVQAFGVRSAGSMLDKDSEMMIWTDIMHEPKVGDDPPEPGMSYLEQDFAKDKVDLMAIHRYLSAKCIKSSSAVAGEDEEAVATAADAAAAAVAAQGKTGGVESVLSWLGQDARQIDPQELDRQLHEVNPMLQADERVVMAFKVGRDTSLFTTKRALFIDVQGWTGSKILYKSVPYASLRAFSVESAGSWDRDAEVKLYLKSYWMPVVNQDLRKGKADIMAIQKFLANQLFGGYDGAPPPGAAAESLSAPAADDGSGGVEGFLAWMGGDARQIDAGEVDARLHAEPPVLLSDEKVESAFKVGRDMCVFTSKRVLMVDVQGWSGSKVEYFSVPLKHCAAHAVQSPGVMDFDCESSIYTDVPGASRLGRDLRRGKVDIFAYEAALAAKLL